MMTHMKRSLVFALLFIAGLSMSACSSNPSYSINNSNSDGSSSSSFIPTVPSKEGGITIEAFTEEINKLEPQSNNRNIRVSYHIVETLEGSVPGATKRNGDLLPEGETITDLVLESRNNSANNLKIISGQANTSFSQHFTSGVSIGFSDHLSYLNTRRDAVTREAQPGWNVFKENLKINPFDMWMVESGNRPANADVEGTFFAYTEDERTFDRNGYCQTMMIKEFTYIDGIYNKWDVTPQNYQGSFTAIAQATFEYLE